MKKSTIIEINDVVNNIQNDQFSSADIKALFIDLRFATPKSEILKEIGDFAAHSDERDRGILYTHLESFLSRFLNVANFGGRITFPNPPFSQEQIVDDLIRALEANNITGVDQRKIKSQSFYIMQNILKMVAGAKIVKTPFKQCEFSEIEKVDNGLVVYYSFGPFKSNIIKARTVRTVALFAQMG